MAVTSLDRDDLFTAALLLTLAWGVFAFGAVYAWAYIPLLLSVVTLGVWGLVVRTGSGTRRTNGTLAAGCALVAVAVLAQMIPLPREMLVAFSPATDRFLQEYNLAYAVGLLTGQRVAHPLTIQIQQTRLGLAFICGFSVFLLGLARALDGLRLRRIVPGVVALGAVVAAVGVIQRPLFSGKMYGFWTPVAGPLQFNPGGGPFGPFINRNHFAGWMLMVIPLSIGYFKALTARGARDLDPGWRSWLLWLSSRQASSLALVGFAIVVMALSLVLTLSRSGITCLLVALAISIVFVFRERHGWSKRATVVVLLAASAVIALGRTGADVILARFDRVDWTLDGRLFAWQDAARVITAFPLVGTGLNTYGTSMLLYQSFQRNDIHFNEAHNDYLQLMAEGGLLLVLPALILAGVFVWQVWNRFREGLDDQFGYAVRTGAVTGLIAIALQEIVDFSLQMPGNAALFSVLCGIAVRKARGRPRPNQLEQLERASG